MPIPHPFITYFLDQTVNQQENAEQSLTAVLGKGLDHIIAHFTVFTLATVPPPWRCMSSCSWKHHKWGFWLKSEREGAGSVGERSRKQFTCYKVAEKLKATAFWLAAKWICNYFIYFNKIKLKPTELGLLISVRAQWGNKNGHSLWTHNYWRQKWSPALLSIIKMLNTEEIFIKYNLFFILLHLILAVCFSVFLQPI